MDTLIIAFGVAAIVACLLILGYMILDAFEFIMGEDDE
jgi:hypothetical protein